MADRQASGESTSLRLAARSAGLQRKEGPDGGEVYTGELARRALRAVGARAMTYDETIFVDESFDLSRPEDQALYAHERVHQLGSGGTDTSHGSHDAEEAIARSVESMVFHRSKAGGDFGNILREATEVSGGGAGGEPAPETAASNLSEAQSAYAQQRAAGKGHPQIVKELAAFCFEQIMKNEEYARMRLSPHRQF
jgi:hypothetical protein